MNAAGEAETRRAGAARLRGGRPSVSRIRSRCNEAEA